MLRWIFTFTLVTGVLLIPAGILGFPLMMTDEQARFKKVTATVESVSWPTLTLREGARSWQLKRWVPLPWFSKGQTIEIALDPYDEARVYFIHGAFHPLLLLLYGFALTMCSLVALVASPSPSVEIVPDAMPAFPVELTGDRGKGITLLIAAAGLIGWVIYDWFNPEPGPSRFSFFADTLRFGGGLILGMGGLHWCTMVVTVTAQEIVESSIVTTKRVRLGDVKSLELEPIYGRKTSNHQSKPPIVAWLLLLKSADGATLYSMEGSLSPAAERIKVENYLRKRFGPGRAAKVKWREK